MPYEEFEQSGFNVRIEHDNYPLNPRTDYDSLGTMACVHRRYDLGDSGGFENLRDAVRQHPLWHDCWQDYNSDKFQAEDEDHDWWVKTAIRFGFVMLPLYLYDHGGITMRCSPFSCPWDSGQVGVIFCSPVTMRKEYGIKAGRRVTRKVKEKVIEVLKAEVETYDQYLIGDVWGYVIENEDGEHEDSCWGFFGLDWCRQEALEAVERCAAERAEQEKLDAADKQVQQFGISNYYM